MPTRTVSTPDHPIAVVAARTGLSRDVIRAWERRYGVVAPTRSAGGQRLYSDDEIERFRLLALARRHGRSIRSVADLETEAIARLVADDEAAAARASAGAIPGISTGTSAGAASVAAAPAAGAATAFAGPAPTDQVVADAMGATVSLDAAALDGLLRRAVARNGASWFVEALVPALMREVGDGWAAGRVTVASEHLTAAVVQAIVLEIVRVPRAPDAPRIVVATPAGERHAVGAALAAAAASLEGWDVVFLGPDVPAPDVAAAVASAGAVAVALSVVHVPDVEHTAAELTTIREEVAPTATVVVGGAAAPAVLARVRAGGFVAVGDIPAFRATLRGVASGLRR